ncbi:hypothetical protein GCM10022261_04950 [Brevibacterium daeguense]|uniref:DUF4383 domain-containing protein n=1 Tax=Brevibacterium daeguense TaxID=909936 RepID=A0ABP8EGA0_9MICO|nr:hypothetical protein [Brevibacterium daeguense]
MTPVPAGTAPEHDDKTSETSAPVQSYRSARADRIIAVILLVIAVLNVLGCAAGAWGLAAGGAELFGVDILAGTRFAGMYGAGAALLALVGAVQLLAVIAHLLRSRWTAAAHALAGFTMMTWIVGELLVVDVYFFLQPLYFGIGAIQVTGVLVLLGVFRPTWRPR